MGEQPVPGPEVARYGDDPSQYVEVWDPGREPIGTAVLIHGGYWRDRYGLDLMHPMADHLRRSGWRAANIEYRRLAEQDQKRTGDQGPGLWPEMSADVLTAIDVAIDVAPGLDSDAGSGSRGPIVAIGHSAGGQLALWAGANHPGLDAVVALAPVADLVAADRLDLSQGVVRQLLGGASTARPVRYRSASPAARIPLGLPQLVVHGSIDDSVPQQISFDYATGATAAGDPVDLLTPEGVDHFHIIDPGHDIWREIDNWLAELVGGSKWQAGRG